MTNPWTLSYSLSFPNIPTCSLFFPSHLSDPLVHSSSEVLIPSSLLYSIFLAVIYTCITVYNPAGSLFSLPSRIAIANFDGFSHITNTNSKILWDFVESSGIKAPESQKEMYFPIYVQIPGSLRNVKRWSSMVWHLQCAELSETHFLGTPGPGLSLSF